MWSNVYNVHVPGRLLNLICPSEEVVLIGKQPPITASGCADSL